MSADTCWVQLYSVFRYEPFKMGCGALLFFLTPNYLVKSSGARQQSSICFLFRDHCHQYILTAASSPPLSAPVCSWIYGTMWDSLQAYLLLEVLFNYTQGTVWYCMSLSSLHFVFYVSFSFLLLKYQLTQPSTVCYCNIFLQITLKSFKSSLNFAPKSLYQY